MQRRKKMECGRGEGKESAYPSYLELLIYAHPCTEMHTRIRKCASVFVHIHTTKRTNTQIQHMQDKGNSESNWKIHYSLEKKYHFFFYFPKVS